MNSLDRKCIHQIMLKVAFGWTNETLKLKLLTTNIRYVTYVAIPNYLQSTCNLQLISQTPCPGWQTNVWFVIYWCSWSPVINRTRTAAIRVVKFQASLLYGKNVTCQAHMLNKWEWLIGSHTANKTRPYSWENSTWCNNWPWILEEQSLKYCFTIRVSVLRCDT